MPNLECFGWFREASPQDSPLSEGEQGKTFSSRLFAHSFCHLTYTPHNHAIPLSLDTSPTTAEATSRSLPATEPSPAPRPARPAALDRFACLFSVQAAGDQADETPRRSLSITPSFYGLLGCLGFFPKSVSPLWKQAAKVRKAAPPGSRSALPSSASPAQPSPSL